MKFLTLPIISLLITLIVSCDQQPVKKATPVGVVFNKETLKRVGNDGDNWCLTWAVDDAQITSMCDGNWMAVGKYNTKTEAYHNHLYKITGGPDHFTRCFLYQYPDFRGNYDGWYGYGIIAIDSTIYSMVSKTLDSTWKPPFQGLKMLKSPDNGKTWYRINSKGEEKLLETFDRKMRDDTTRNEMFLIRDFGRKGYGKVAYPFTYCSFVQRGRANSEAGDDYVYIYAPEFCRSNKLLLARVNKNELGHLDKWEFFKKWNGDKPVWTKDIEQRGAVYEFPAVSEHGELFGWYSWLPSVVWNKGLGLYIMAAGGTRANNVEYPGDTTGMYYDNWVHTKTGSLGFWYSENPYGPWKQFYYTDYWFVDTKNNRTYQPKLSPKWISKDGKRMTLIWSDEGDEKEGVEYGSFYTWNQMEIELIMK